MICQGSGAQGSAGRVADATADAGRPLHHDVPATQGPSLVGRARLHVREESAPIQTRAARIREL